MDKIDHYTQRSSTPTAKPANKNELILYRLDAIDQKLVDLQVLMTRTALQEQRITELESAINTYNTKMEDYALLKEKVKCLSEANKNARAKWWQIVVMALNPIVTALVVFALSGGVNVK